MFYVYALKIVQVYRYDQNWIVGRGTEYNICFFMTCTYVAAI